MDRAEGSSAGGGRRRRSGRPAPRGSARRAARRGATACRRARARPDGGTAPRGPRNARRPRSPRRPSSARRARASGPSPRTPPCRRGAACRGAGGCSCAARPRSRRAPAPARAPSRAPPAAGHEMELRLLLRALLRHRARIEPLVVEALLDRERHAREERRDPLPRVPVPVKRVRREAARARLPRDRAGDLAFDVAHVEDVAPPVPPLLARADVHDRYAEERALADPLAGVADGAAGIGDEPQEVHRGHSLEEVDRLRPLVLAERADRGRGPARAGVDVRPEPERGEARVAHGDERLQRMRSRLLVLRRHRVLEDDDVSVRERDLLADAAVLREWVEVELGRAEHLRREVDRRAAGDEDGGRVLAHPDEAVRRRPRGREVHVRELRDGVADLLVDRAGHLTALHVRDRDVHVRGRDRRRERLVPVRDRHDDVGLQVVEDGRELEEPEPRRLRHRGEVLALEHHVDARGDREAVLLDEAYGRAVPVEERRRADDELEPELGIPRDRIQRRLDPAVARPGGDHHADLPHAVLAISRANSRSVSLRSSSSFTSRTRRAPRSSGRRAAGMPVPGFFSARCSLARTVPDGRSARATTDFVNVLRSGSSAPAAASLSTGLASILSMKRTPRTSSASSAVVTETGTSGPNISRESVTCTSRTSTPRTAAARPGKIVPEWSESPTGQPYRSRSSEITFRPTFSGGHGYDDVHWRTATLLPAPFRSATAPSTSSSGLIPVERRTGRESAASRSRSGRFPVSPEATFHAPTPTRSRSSTASIENGDERKRRPRSSAWRASSRQPLSGSSIRFQYA